MAERHKQLLLEPDDPALTSPVLREVGGASHVPDVSLTLRLARERAGYEIKDVAQVLRIRAAHLEAIEAGRFKDLPGPTYVTGFLRSYADFLGLDRDEVVVRYREEIGSAGRPKLSFPVPSYEGRMPRSWLILVALVLVGLAYGGWHYYSTRDSGPREAVAPPPADATMQVAGSTADQSAPSASDRSSIADPDVSSETVSDASLDATAGAADSAPSDTATAATSGSVGGSLFHGSGADATTTDVTSTEVAETEMAETADVAATDTSVATASTPEASTPPSTSDGATASISTSGSLWDSDAAPASASVDPVAPDIGGEPSGELGAALAEDGDFAASTPEPVRSAEADVAALERDGRAAVADTVADTEAAPVAMAGADARVVITARADSWVQIQGPGNELVMTRILRPGERYAVPARPGLTMVTGNAGGLEVMVDGQPIGSLGAMGVVKRGIVLDPDNLRATYGSAGQ